MPEPQQESFLTPQGKAEWMFAEPVNKITPVSVGTMSVAEGHLQFTLGKEGALIGWGNYEGKQPHAERVHLWDGPMTVTVMLKSVRFDREMHACWWRKEFTLPPGKIWRAVADVGMMCSLAVNGQAVPSVSGMRIRPSFNFANGEMSDCEALDLAPLLTPGANAIAVHAARNGAAPYITFALTVVMESGEVVQASPVGSETPKKRRKPRRLTNESKETGDDLGMTMIPV